MHLSSSKSLSSMDQPSTSASKRPGQYRPNNPPPTVVDATVDPPEQPTDRFITFTIKSTESYIQHENLKLLVGSYINIYNSYKFTIDQMIYIYYGSSSLSLWTFGIFQ
jgi:hypothetical protein